MRICFFVTSVSHAWSRSRSNLGLFGTEADPSQGSAMRVGDE